MSEDGLESVISDLEAQLAEAGATIAALREAPWPEYRELNALVAALRAWNAELQAAHCTVTCPDRHHEGDRPLPPAAAKLLAERDAGRALYEAVRHCDGANDPQATDALEAYRKVVEG